MLVILIASAVVHADKEINDNVTENLINRNDENKNHLTNNDEEIVNLENFTGMYIGDRCYTDCNSELQYVVCNFQTQICSCDQSHPVVIDRNIGCGKPKKLGEQCFYHQTCRYNDENSLCIQVSHNALCQCADGYHSVSYSKPIKRVFCTQDIAVLTSNLPTLLGVTTGIAILAGLICMVLHLFSKTKYPRHRNFGDASIPPPVMYSSDAGIPLTIQSGRPSSRSSSSIESYSIHRSCSAQQLGSKGILVSTSRSGAARSAAIMLISCHISAVDKNNSNIDNRCDSMTKYLHEQLQHQKKLLNLELPSNMPNNKIRAMLGINDGIDNCDDEVKNLESGSVQINVLPTPASETAKFAVLEDQV